jgi:hypothetical protein
MDEQTCPFYKASAARELGQRNRTTVPCHALAHQWLDTEHGPDQALPSIRRRSLAAGTRQQGEAVSDCL